MQLTVRGKQIDVGDALRTHVSDALNSTTAKYFNNAIEANVVFSRNAHLIRSDLSVHVGRNILLQSNAEAESPYHAFDAAADKLAKRLRRYKRRLRDHHNGDGQQPALPGPGLYPRGRNPRSCWTARSRTNPSSSPTSRPRSRA